MFDATVTGNPIAISGNALTMTSTSGIVSSATPASLDGVRLMFAVGVDQLANGARFFGHVDGATTWDVLGNINASGVVLQGRYVSGSTTTLTPVPRIALPASGFVLIEVEFTTSQWRTWINGTPATIANSAVPAFLVSNVGIGTTVGNRFIGPFGDVFCVLTGQSDTDAAIAAAKERLNARFGTPT